MGFSGSGSIAFLGLDRLSGCGWFGGWCNTDSGCGVDCGWCELAWRCAVGMWVRWPLGVALGLVFGFCGDFVLVFVLQRSGMPSGLVGLVWVVLAR